MEQDEVPPPTDRRTFFKKACATVIGAVVGLFPFAAGLAVFLDPIRRRSNDSDFVLVGSVSALPSDGTPRKFPVITSHQDAWNKLPNVPVGAVYVRRTGETTVQAFNVVCPHAGCFVDYVPARKGFLCPCHNSTFALTGKINDPKSPAARGLDELEVEIRGDTEIWVKFQNFHAGGAAKIPQA